MMVVVLDVLITVCVFALGFAIGQATLTWRIHRAQRKGRR
jgi:hypothetical protein